MNPLDWNWLLRFAGEWGFTAPIIVSYHLRSLPSLSDRGQRLSGGALLIEVTHDATDGGIGMGQRLVGWRSDVLNPSVAIVSLDRAVAQPCRRAA